MHIKRKSFKYKSDTYMVLSQSNNQYTGLKKDGCKKVTVNIDAYSGLAIQI